MISYVLASAIAKLDLHLNDPGSPHPGSAVADPAMRARLASITNAMRELLGDLDTQPGSRLWGARWWEKSRCPVAADGRHILDPASFHSDDEHLVVGACVLCDVCGVVPIFYEDIRWDE